MNTSRLARTVAALTAAGALALLTGCSSDSDSSATSSAPAGPAACATPDGPLVGAAGQPSVQVPQPPNWERLADQESGVVRLALVNQQLTSNGFAPNLVVTAVPSQGDFDQIIDNELAQLRQQADVSDDGEKSTICGFDAFTVTYSASGAEGVPVHPITSRMIVVPNGDDTSTTVVLTVQSTDPDNATYRADSTTMLDGVQIGANADQ